MLGKAAHELPAPEIIIYLFLLKKLLLKIDIYNRFMKVQSKIANRSQF